MERSAMPEYVRNGHVHWKADITHYHTYHISVGDGLFKEIRFQDYPKNHMMNKFLQSGYISPQTVINIANNMLSTRQRVTDQISKGLAAVQGKLTFDAAVHLILEYMGTVTGGMEFEFHNFTQQHKWAQPKTWTPIDGNYHGVHRHSVSRETFFNEWTCPSHEWLFHNNMSFYWNPSEAEEYSRARQGLLFFGLLPPEPLLLQYPEIRKLYYDENVPCEENVISEYELICSFLGRNRRGFYREYRVRYTNEMMNFDVPDMRKLMIDVARMIKDRENSKPGIEDLWVPVRNAINPNNAKYLYAMLKQGKEAIERFEMENWQDPYKIWQRSGSLSEFFRFFNRTIHFESPKNKPQIPNIVHMSGDGVSGVEFIRSIKYQKDGKPDYGEYTFGVERPLTEADMFPPFPEPDEKYVEPCVDRRDHSTREQKDKEDLEESKTELLQKPEKTAMESVIDDNSEADRQAALLNVSETELQTPPVQSQKSSTDTTIPTETTGKNTMFTERSENTREETVDAPQLTDVVPKSNHTGTLKNQNIAKNETPANHTSSDNKTHKLQSKQMSVKKQDRANQHKDEPVAKKELIKKESVDSTSSSESPPSTEFSGSAGDTRSVDQSDTEAEKATSKKVKTEKEETAGDKAEIVVDSSKVVLTGEETVKDDRDKSIEGTAKSSLNKANDLFGVAELGLTKTSIRKAKKAAKLERKNDERLAKAAAKLRAQETLVATAKDGSFTKAEFDISIKGASSSSPDVAPTDPKNVIVESKFTGEKASLFVNDMLLAAAGDLFKVPDVPGKKYDIQYTLLEEEEADNCDEYIPGSTVCHDYRPGARNRSGSSSHEGTSNDVYNLKSALEDNYTASRHVESTSNQPGTSAAVNNRAAAKPAASRRGKGKGHSKKSGNGKADQANGEKATLETSTSKVNEATRGPLNPHNGNTPMIDITTPEIEPSEKLPRVSDPDVHDMCRRLKFLADKKAIGGLKDVEKRYQAVVRQRLQKFQTAYLFRLRMAKAMLYIIDIDPCEDLSGEKEMAILRLALSYSTRYKDAEDCIQGRQIDEVTSGGTFLNGRESDSIEKGLRFVDLKLAELRSPDATYTSYRTISLAINRATDEQKLLVSLIGDKVNFSGYRDYL